MLRALALAALLASCDHQGFPPPLSEANAGPDQGRCWTMYDPRVIGCNYLDHGISTHEICTRDARSGSGWWCSGHRVESAPPCFICAPGGAFR